jgi:hypothetical protein
MLKIENKRNYCRKQVENKVSSLEDYAIEIVQEIEKINNAMGQRV